MDMDMWSSLPADLLLEIFRRLETTAVVRSAAACRPWRRAIIGNASCLRPRPDRFLPDLLLGFFHQWWYGSGNNVRLQRAPGQLGSALGLTAAAEITRFAPLYATASSFIPAEAAAGVDVALYDEPLSSRDGLLLLGGSSSRDDLCLCNPMAGSCAFLPAAAFQAHAYVVVTGYDLPASDDDDDLAVRILAVESEYIEDGMTYQLFSFASGAGGAGAWGPVKRSPEFKKGLKARMRRCGEVICGGAVHWPGVSAGLLECTVAIDVRTGRTWTTPVPQQCTGTWHDFCCLAKSGDGQLSVVLALSGHRVRIWVLVGGDEGWAPPRTIDVPSLVPHCEPRHGWSSLRLSSFCPRSGCVLAAVPGQELRIDVADEKGSRRRRPVECIGSSRVATFPYEMDWSTYISRMKYF
ncbi:hypothetical protein ACP70R_007736 [Stipagrostis hirtigluma subsp. patula]